MNWHLCMNYAPPCTHPLDAAGLYQGCYLVGKEATPQDRADVPMVPWWPAESSCLLELVSFQTTGLTMKPKYHTLQACT